MNAGAVSGVLTILAFTAFVCVVIWVFLIKRKSDFDAAACLPLEDEQAIPATADAKNKSTSP
jgi:cbb3-type cytochrome oxidase subunit 3